MRLFKFVRLFTLAAPVALLGACSDTPVDEGSGDAFAIVSDKSETTHAVNDRFTVTAQVIDRLGTPLPEQIQVASAKADVVAVDSSRFVSELQETRIYLRATKVDAGAAIVLTAGGISDTVNVKVLSGPFPGTIAATAGAGGGTSLVFTAPTALFDTDATVALTGTSDTGFLISSTPTRYEYLLPFGTPAGAIGYSVANAGPSQFTLTGSFNLATATPANDNLEPNDSPDAAKPITAGTPMFGAVNATDNEEFFVLTVTEAGTYDFTIRWSDAADIDFYIYDGDGHNIGKAESVANPENVNGLALTPGTYYIEAFVYEAAGPATTYRVLVTRK